MADDWYVAYIIEKGVEIVEEVPSRTCIAAVSTVSLRQWFAGDLEWEGEGEEGGIGDEEPDQTVGVHDLSLGM